jgi:hypothetical protein
MAIDKLTGYGIPSITVNFNKIPLTTNDEGLITYSYKRVGGRRRFFNVSVPDSLNYYSAPEQRVRGRYYTIKLQCKQSKQISGSILFVDAINNRPLRSSVVIMKNGKKLGRW